ncbi:type II toxin-antitoxin system HicA family toxin [Candidatus Uhrbacteria bacterium]|nr:type II toxin-antitoxin system HicA family toxin [Candidatus Uhrbacteria bacterium]
MPKLPVVTPKKLIKALQRQGFFVDRQRGSHIILRHIDGRMSVIPMHTRDIPNGTLKGILEDIDWTVEDLLGHL